MSENPLTDPTSLIAYRLAHGAPPPESRPAPASADGSAGAIGLGLFIVAAITGAFALAFVR